MVLERFFPRMRDNTGKKKLRGKDQGHVYNTAKMQYLTVLITMYVHTYFYHLNIIKHNIIIKANITFI